MKYIITVIKSIIFEERICGLWICGAALITWHISVRVKWDWGRTSKIYLILATVRKTGNIREAYLKCSGCNFTEARKDVHSEN